MDGLIKRKPLIWMDYLRAVFIAVSAAVVRGAGAIPFGRVAGAKSDVNERAVRYMDRYGRSILQLAYSYVHNREDAEDVLQETLIRVLRAKPDFMSEANEKAYLLRTASNLAKNMIQYNKIREADELNDELTYQEREDLSFVWGAVKSLPETGREVIHLFYQEGYRTAEIAEILGRKESTVRSDLKRARERLKTILKEAYDFE